MENKAIKKVQEGLLAAGFSPGEIDGIWGRRSISALKGFQKSQKLESNGILDEGTLKKLAPFSKSDVKLNAPFVPWLMEAKRLMNTREVPGKGNNPKILDWSKGLDVAYKGDDVPWCGLFVGHCIASSLPEEPLPSNILTARAWLKAGIPITPREGAIMVFWRRARNSWEGHVGFYAGQDGDSFLILGGNQSNSVNYAWIPSARLLGARWPQSAQPLMADARILTVHKNDEFLSIGEASMK
ncbi:NlpC/P60 family protein [Massilia glaciei]|uniref:TIGR02594 family protein n=1 Tax=Massilia glaciei TaxID=1524097 RepID=A0A2U2HHU3_9BURK|nr:TIGR02594 family protein [Massilia glaciei]PWF45449.1 TIGR02594 family protein [Massilia glaciei]